MENASKALLMAGEALIGVLLLTILAFTFQRIYTFAEDYQSKNNKQKMVVFNTQFTKYATNTGSEPTYIYTEDVVTLTERVLNWNKITADSNEKIVLYILDKDKGEMYSTENVITEFNREVFLDTYKLRGDPTKAEMKEYKFSCEIGVNQSSGRVNQVIIQIQGERDG